MPTNDYEKGPKMVKEVNKYSKEAESLKKVPEFGFIILAKSKHSKPKSSHRGRNRQSWYFGISVIVHREVFGYETLVFINVNSLNL